MSVTTSDDSGLVTEFRFPIGEPMLGDAPVLVAYIGDRLGILLTKLRPDKRFEDWKLTVEPVLVDGTRGLCARLRPERE